MDIVFSLDEKRACEIFTGSFLTIAGTPKGIRTPDLLVRSQTLYPAELSAHVLVAYIEYHASDTLSTIFFSFSQKI